MNVRTLSALTLLLLLTSLASAQSWEWQNPRVCGSYLSDIGSVEGNNVWATTSSGDLLWSTNAGQVWELRTTRTGPQDQTVFVDAFHGWGINRYSREEDSLFAPIFYTDDGGFTWSVQFSLTRVQYTTLTDMVFVNAQTGWVIGWQNNGGPGWGVMLHTVDGGATWTELPFERDMTPTLVDFIDTQEGWATQDPFVWHTVDGGETWTQISSTCPFFQSFKFSDSNHGWAVGLHEVYHTVDGGLTWTPQGIQISDNQFWWELDSFDDQRVSVIGSAGRICSTQDGGGHWTMYHVADTTLQLNAVHIADAEHGWIAAWGGVILYTEDGGSSWTYQNGNPATTRCILTDVDFADSRYGWAVGRYVILHTTDSGQSWGVQDSILGGIAVAAVDSQTAWLCDNSYQLRHTNNGGAEWNVVNMGAEISVHRVTHVGSNHLWVVGSSGNMDNVVAHSTDGGLSWELYFDSNVNGYTFDAAFVDTGNGWRACGGDDGGYGMILHTEDGGRSWTPQVSLSHSSIDAISFVDSLHGWACGGFGALVRTSDGGSVWDSLPDADWGVAGIQFFDTLNGWAFSSYDGLSRRTTDGGLSWQKIPIGMGESVSAMDFVDVDHGWIVGWRGAIMNYGGTNMNSPDPATNLPHSFALSVYPNPFNPSATLEFALPQTGRTTLRIYNTAGQFVETLMDGLYQKGQHRLSFDGRGLPSGLYFARMESAGSSSTTKLVLIK